MSRKSRGNKHKSKHVQAVPPEAPDEILAEGSGPVASVEAPLDRGAVDLADGAVAHVGIDEVDGGPNALVAAANDVSRRRRKRRKGEPAEEIATTDEPAVEVVEDAVDAASLEPAGEDSLGTSVSDDASLIADGAGDAELGEASEQPVMDVAGDDGEGTDISEPGTGDVLEAGSEDDATDVGATLPTSAASMDDVQLKHLVEALVFASDKPITVQRLRQLTRVSDTRRLEAALAALATDFADRGLVLQQVSGGYQFRTRTQFSAWVQQLIAGRPVRLSRAQLETLAIIAYRQPITRPEIDDIRGVDSSGTLKMLMDRALIRILGKKEEVGRPMLYGTTKEFLDFFSLGDLRELPTLREYSELTDESRQVMSDRLGVSADGSDDPDGGSDPEGGGGGGGPSGEGGFEPDGAIEDAGVTETSTLDEFLASYSAAVPDRVDPASVVPASVVANEPTLVADDELIEAANNEPIEAASDEVIEAASDDGMEAASDEVIEAASDEVIEAATEAASDEVIEAASDKPIEAASDESIEAASDELIEAAANDAGGSASDFDDEIQAAAAPEAVTPVIDVVSTSVEVSESWSVASAEWPQDLGRIGEPHEARDVDEPKTRSEIDPIVVEAQAGHDPAVEQSTE